MGYFRHPRTTQEIRLWEDAVETSKEYPQLRLRSRRSPKNLPTLYDDLIRGTYRKHQTWKLHREQQWKVPVEAKPEREKIKYSYDTDYCVHPSWSRVNGLKLSAWTKDWVTREGRWVPYRVRLAYRKPKYGKESQGSRVQSGSSAARKAA